MYINSLSDKNINHEIINYCEKDKYASFAYSKLFNVSEDELVQKPSQPTHRNVKTKEQKRQEAEARKALNQRLKKTKQRIKEIENELFPAQERHSELEKMMADNDLYADAQKFQACMDEYTELSQKIGPLEEEWLELQEKVEEETKAHAG